MFARLLPFHVCCALVLFSAPAHGQSTSTAQQATAQLRYPQLAGKRLLFLGDSVTANGQYVSIVEYYYARQNPSQPLDAISLGLASETVSGLSEKDHPFPRPVLSERLGRALELAKPDVVFACYGMNDGIYHPPMTERFDRFKDGINKLVQSTRDANAPLILITPPPFDEQAVSTKTLGDGASDYSWKRPYRQYGAVLTEYSRWLMSLRDQGTCVNDINGTMNRALTRRRRTNPDFLFSPDGIHPNNVGHLVMARNLMRSFQIPFDRGDVESTIGKIETDPLYQMIDARRRARASGWTKYVGYVRGERLKSDSIDETERAAAAAMHRIREYLRAHPPQPVIQAAPTTGTQSQAAMRPSAK